MKVFQFLIRIWIESTLQKHLFWNKSVPKTEVQFNLITHPHQIRLCSQFHHHWPSPLWCRGHCSSRYLCTCKCLTCIQIGWVHKKLLWKMKKKYSFDPCREKLQGKQIQEVICFQKNQIHQNVFILVNAKLAFLIAFWCIWFLEADYLCCKMYYWSTVRVQLLPAVSTNFSVYNMSAFLWCLVVFLWKYAVTKQEWLLPESG